jgi:hypothetical protein
LSLNSQLYTMVQVFSPILLLRVEAVIAAAAAAVLFPSKSTDPTKNIHTDRILNWVSWHGQARLARRANAQSIPLRTALAVIIPWYVTREL